MRVVCKQCNKWLATRAEQDVEKCDDCQKGGLNALLNIFKPKK